MTDRAAKDRIRSSIGAKRRALHRDSCTLCEIYRRGLSNDEKIAALDAFVARVEQIEQGRKGAAQ